MSNAISKKKRRPCASRIAVSISEDRDGLRAIHLSRQVARYLHTGLRLLNRRLVPLTHSRLSSICGSKAQASDPTPATDRPRDEVLFHLAAPGDNFKSYFLI